MFENLDASFEILFDLLDLLLTLKYRVQYQLDFACMKRASALYVAI